MIGNKVTEKDIRNWLADNGYFGESARFDHVELHAIHIPGWLQIFRFEVDAKKIDGDWTHLFGSVRDDERIQELSNRTIVKAFFTAAEQQIELDELSQGLIVKRTRFGSGESNKAVAGDDPGSPKPMRRRRSFYMLLLPLIGLAIGILIVNVMNQTSKPSIEPGVSDGRLAECPATPNCVSSYATDEVHFIKPFQFDGTPIAAMKRLKAVIGRMPRHKIESESSNYLYVTFRSFVFRFVDDVEFYFDSEKGMIQLRSASRFGYSDLGVNRKRIEEIRTSFENSESK